jgi:CHAD domain-containing protein
MAEGKWITGLKGDMPLPAAAQAVLTARLAPVEKFLPLAIRSAHQDIEHVHRLRVATRRCRAALDLFRPCLGEKLFERLRRTLRRIRRTAGDARDWDVFLLRLQEPLDRAEAKEAPGLHWLAGQAVALRTRAQGDLRERGPGVGQTLRRLRRAFEGQWRQTSAERSVVPSLQQAAAPHLLHLVGALEQAAAGDLDEYAQLHQVRIHGKRLRYAIEVFASAVGAELKKELYPEVEKMQEILGDLNDHAMAVQRVSTMRSEARRFQPKLWLLWRPGVEAFLRAARRQRAQQRERFDQFWEKWLEDELGKRFRDVVSE